MKDCGCCGKSKSKGGYSKNQWSKAQKRRRCQGCIYSKNQWDKKEQPRECQEWLGGPTMKVCGRCGKSKSKGEYSKNQWKKKQQQPRGCQECLGPTMRVCGCCGESKSKGEYSNNQLVKKNEQRRCQECIAANKSPMKEEPALKFLAQPNTVFCAEGLRDNKFTRDVSGLLSDDDESPSSTTDSSSLCPRRINEGTYTQCQTTEQDAKQSETDDEECVIVVEAQQKVSSFRTNANPSILNDNDDDVELLGATGPNALEDFPHPHEDCVRYPSKGPNISAHILDYCPKCYCYVCDVPASQ
jgi:hypothetical protein